MPRCRRSIRLRDAVGDARSKEQIRECLTYGRSALGDPQAYGLRTVHDWGSAWEKVGDDLTALLAIEEPGRRPIALFVMGLLPRQQPTAPLPHDAAGFDVIAADGSTTRFHYHDPRYFGCEAAHLFGKRVIDRTEAELHRTSGTHAKFCEQGGRR